MKKERIEKIARNIMIISGVSIIVADFFLAYFMNKHNEAGLLTYNYTTNLAFIMMFSCPVIFAVMNVTSFIKEMVLLKCGENTGIKTKLSLVSFILGALGFALYFIASSMTSQIAITLGLVSIILIFLSITVFFVYMVKR
ncbi:MAG: hypothetical protein IJ323_06770 [Clostridia bacterium]|nr:hypothetical protein [Clostridia bacterium]